MALNRRDFFAATAGVLVTGASSRNASRIESAASGAGSFADWSAVKAQFDLSPAWLHFSQFFIVSHPRPVREAIERYRRMLDDNPFLAVERGMNFRSHHGEPARDVGLPMRVQQAAARYIGGLPDEVALTDSTTAGLALIYNGLTLKPGDEILTTTHDHFVHHEAIRLAAERYGASWRRVALYDAPESASAEEMVERLRRAIRPATHVVGITWVHSCTGVKLPVKALAQVIADANRERAEGERVLLVLDGAHGLGCQEEAVASVGCDFLAAGTHKWIFAPRGTGIIWAPDRNWELLRPTIPSFYNFEPMAAWQEGRRPRPPTRASWVSPGGFKAYEHQWAMTEAFEFHDHIGQQRVAARIAALNTQCKEGLAGIPKVKLFTPRDPALSGGIICFDVQGRTTDETVARLLERKVIASSSPYKISHARLAPSLVNDEREVEAAVRAVREIA